MPEARMLLDRDQVEPQAPAAPRAEPALPTPSLAGTGELTPAAFRRWVTILIAAGVVCRVVQYLWRQSFWHDEAYLVLNLRSLTPEQLGGPLPRAQAAPPAFLLAQDALATWLGSTELVLRFLPLLAGLASVVLMAILARRLLGTTVAAVCAVALFALSDRLVWHAAEVKQYSSDVLFALLLLLAATWPGWSDARRLAATGLVAAAAVWASHPVVFVFGGIVLVLAVALALPDRRVRWRGARSVLLACGPFVLSFALLYFLSIRHQEQAALYDYWRDRFPDWSRPGMLPVWLVAQSLSLGLYVWELTGPALGLLTVIGAAWLWRRGGEGDRRLVALALAPVGLVLCAALVRRYPFGGNRLTLFTAPALLLLAGAGAQALWTIAPHVRLGLVRARVAGRILVAAVLLVGVAQAGRHLFVPRHRGHVRPAVAHVLAHRQPGDRVYVASEIEPVLCYWPAAEPPPVRLRVEDVGTVRAERCWVIFGYSADRFRRRWRQQVVEPMESEFGAPREAFAIPGAEAFLFEKPQ